MRTARYYLAPFVFALLAIASASGASADSAIVGVNLVNAPYKLSPAQQESILTSMQQAGVQVIRCSVSNNDEGIAFAQRVYAHGIQIEWLIGPVPTPGTPWPHAPAGFKGLWESYPLSASDPDAFRSYFQPLLAKLEAKGIVFSAFELGNEINWAGFNADFTLPSSGRTLELEDLQNDPEGKLVASGFVQYVKTLAVLKDIRDHSKLNGQTPIISAGLADLDSSGWLKTRKADAVSIPATLDFMRTLGLDQLVDGYGLHNYPHSDTEAQLRAHTEQNGLSECQPAGSKIGKPCWITEWGVGGLGSTCPVDDSTRTTQVRQARDYYSQLEHDGILKAIFFYTWQGDVNAAKEDGNSAFRCGALTPSGKLAITPL
jgi:hypothetical protein